MKVSARKCYPRSLQKYRSLLYFLLEKVVCYFGSWAVYRNGNGKYEIPLTQAHLCTHFIYTFAGLYDGVIKSLDPYADLPSGLNGYGKVLELKRLNPDLKVLIAMGGWNEGSQKYSE